MQSSAFHMYQSVFNMYMPSRMNTPLKNELAAKANARAAAKEQVVRYYLSLFYSCLNTRHHSHQVPVSLKDELAKKSAEVQQSLRKKQETVSNAPHLLTPLKKELISKTEDMKQKLEERRRSVQSVSPYLSY